MEGADLFHVVLLVSVGLALANITALLVLFVRRLFIMRIERANAARRLELQDMVYAALDNTGPLSRDGGRLGVRDQRLLLGVVNEMLRGVSGEMEMGLKAVLARSIDLDRMIGSLRRAIPADRAKIAARLAWSDSPAVHAALRAALDDPEPEVVLAAANALITAGQPLRLADLAPKLEARRMLGNRVVRDVFRKLAPANVDSLVILLDDSNPVIAVLAMDAVARVATPEALARLRAAVRTHAVVDARATAARTLGIARDAQAGGVIAAALADPAWEVRAQAAIAAGRIGIPRVLPALHLLLQDRNWWVRLRAAQAMVKLGAEGIAALECLLGDQALGQLADFVLSERRA